MMRSLQSASWVFHINTRRSLTSFQPVVSRCKFSTQQITNKNKPTMPNDEVLNPTSLPVKAEAVEGLPYFLVKNPVPAGTAVAGQENIPALFTPLDVKNLHFHNRLGVSPMVQYEALNGEVTPWHFSAYSSYATRGPGLIIAEATSVVPEGRASLNDAGIWNDDLAKAWKPIVDFVHGEDQIIGLQLGHSGRKSGHAPLYMNPHRGLTREEGGWPDQLYAPSPISLQKGESYTPVEMTKEDIKYTVKKFGEAAKRAVEISKFDFLEIHGAHGYLINEFLSLISNKRTDEYGGSFENRARFVIEVIDEIRSVIPADMPLFIRISASDNVPNNPLGWNIEDSKKLADLIIPHGIDVIDVSSGGLTLEQQRRGNTQGIHVPFSTELKKHVGDRAKIAVVGGIREAAYANKVIEEGHADIVLCGFSFMRNPGLTLAFAEDLGVKVHRALTHF